MKTKLRRILVAVEHMEHRPLAALRKAAELARASGARIELFHAICDTPINLASQQLSPSALQAWMVEVRRQRHAQLQKFARIKALDGVCVEFTVVWDRPACNAIIRGAQQSHSDLVVAGTHPHTFRNRLATDNIDWKLIRLCPVPLLLVKSGRKLEGAPVVVAVDPFHARAAHLDAQMLRTGSAYAHWLKAPVHIFHAFMPLVPVQTLPIAGSGPLMVLTPEEEATHRVLVQRRIAALARSSGMPKAVRHIQFGEVPRELSAVTRGTRAGLVVMGAVSRSILGRILIGNTAERVLDKLTCDVLILKPRDFGASRLAKLSKPAPQFPNVESASMVIL